MKRPPSIQGPHKLQLSNWTRFSCDFEARIGAVGVAREDSGEDQDKFHGVPPSVPALATRPTLMGRTQCAPAPSGSGRAEEYRSGQESAACATRSLSVRGTLVRAASCC